MLSHAGHRVSHVSDGAALIAYLERRIADGSRWPDIVLMDMHMPELDGPAATQALRALEARHGRPATPVLALTANARPEDEEACLAAGMNGYLSKPFERGDLEAAILRLTASRRAA